MKEKQFLQLLKNRKYDELEKRAEALRTPTKQYPTGGWRLFNVYNGLAALPSGATSQQWKLRVSELETWVKRRPGSITAHVALAGAYYHGATLARGAGWADSVTPEMRRTVDERCDQAMKVLSASSSMRRKDPYWYTVAEGVANLQAWPRSEYDKLVDEGINSFPQFNELHFTRLIYLLPRWFGAPGETEAYMTKIADRRGGVAGDILYAQMVWSLDELRIFKNMFEETTISFPRAQKGFKALMAKNPGDHSVASEYAFVAYKRGEKATARDLFDHELKDQADVSVWKTTQYFEKARDWAHSP